MWVCVGVGEGEGVGIRSRAQCPRPVHYSTPGQSQGKAEPDATGASSAPGKPPPSCRRIGGPSTAATTCST